MSESYKVQLQQVEQAINHTESKDQLNELLSLRDSLLEVIALTSETCEPEQTTQNPFDEEYALFKSEIETIDETQNKNYDEDDTSSCEILNVSEDKKVNNDSHSSNTTIEIDSDSSCEIIDDHRETPGIENELANLQGTKCQAPFETDYDETSTYHNALIMSVKMNDSTDQQSLDDILVTVLYTNPICKQMLPCQFFLSGECKYSDDRCYFSHGTQVPLSRLTEFKEPDFNNLKIGSLVLAKSCEGGLWSRAVVLDVTHGTSNNDGSCVVKYETKGLGETEVPMQNIFPLIGNDEEEFYELSSDSDEESKIKERDSAIVNKVLLNTETIQSLGSWEKHTKGIGSKLMAKMGYIMGAGLGKNGEGRINPVEATVLPKGKSLDHCMSVKNTAQIQDARKKRKQQLRLERCMKKSYEKSLEKPPDVFTFLNNQLNIKNINQDKNVMDQKKLKSSTIHDLNVRSLKIEEDIKRQLINVQELNHKLNRSTSGSVQHNMVSQKLIEANNHLSHLRDEEKSIKKEHTYRETHKKMTVF
ncbi:zinc finger CCCH-type with G patch domain-containing protein [Acyrthosiphon pisum]|uniref:Zinc finger CCCH-type with G patch domain-containing protein n=1 Tax=Acyrthosiphon pisum TaxID=7029 RepID=A0A8R2AA91_ACYPI|nr:zinc finger CCCH-type with G patch domain-containing protein [Acyrthosiphon pisum]XP_016661938.1 zinc finger CCCH-type with G patch domain-containing protein [Acyrthosiphon pisum]XP_016661944.1 zinc finger CCCH-type with G patch domain-containing protein [Acyrthosiphon pisum]XP_029343678.1 zinc finger CCCH-type with G patch domain-containing protein [Acyrthosiphon pisum]|eukprot:XP_001952828.1 PREDICTED: zinc finger CCCH-type with G patch domain-containing protein [Acyrthosiphon pisum]